MKHARTLAILALALCLAGCSHETDKDPKQVGGTPSDPAAPTPPDGASDNAHDSRVAGLATLLNSREAVDEETVEEWLRALAAGGDDGFVAATQAADELVIYMAESQATTGFCLTDAVDPHQGARAGAAWEARAATKNSPDLLRCTWTARGLDLVLTETVNLVVVHAEHSSSEDPLTAATLQDMIAKVVRSKSADHDWVFKIPEDANLAQGTHLFASNTAPPSVFRMASRDDRADVLVVDGHVCFLFYKKIAQRLSFEDENAWFRDSTRTALR